MSQFGWLAVFIAYGLLYIFIHFQNTVYPEPKMLSTANAGQFVEEMARKHLKEITDFGHRYVGSKANEEIVVQYLLTEIDKIKKTSSDVHNFDIDVQLTTGTFSLPFLSPFTSYYHNVKNVIVKFSPRGGAKDSLLVNCHYDSVLDSPGEKKIAIIKCMIMMYPYRTKITVISTSGYGSYL